MDKIPAEKAKQGRTGRPVLLVLLAGLCLAMAAWAGAELYGEMIDGSSPQPVDARNAPATAD